MSEEKFFTVAEAAKILGLTEYTVRKKIRDGQIKAVQGASDREGYKIPCDEILSRTNANKPDILLEFLAKSGGVAAGGLTAMGAFPFVGFWLSKVLDAISGKKIKVPKKLKR